MGVDTHMEAIQEISGKATALSVAEIFEKIRVEIKSENEDLNMKN